MRRKTCCITGHRPNAFPWKDHTGDIRFHILLKRIENAIDSALDFNVRRFICGNALGVDTWAAQIILKKKQYHPDIYLEIVLPFSLHNSNNSSCKDVQEKADLVHIISTQRCRKAAFFERDKYMIDNSDMVIAVYDDKVSRKGGTQRTFVMAKDLISYKFFGRYIGFVHIIYMQYLPPLFCAELNKNRLPGNCAFMLELSQKLAKDQKLGEILLERLDVFLSITGEW